MIDFGLADWRLLLQRLHGTFVAPSFGAAAAFVVRVAESVSASEDVHVDVRPSGLVHVSVPMASVEVAEAISALAASDGLAAQPLAASTCEVAIDALDIPAVKPFWRAVLGYVDDGDVVLVDPAGIGPQFWFQQMDAPRPQRNRIHIDVTVPHDEAPARIEAALAAGGVLVTEQFARSFWVLADAEGNEACICTWQDRD